MKTRARDISAIAVWSAGLCAAAVLALERFREVSFDSQPDLEGFFLPAAQAIAAGESPFAHLAYPPVVPLLLLPVVDAPWAGQYWTALQVFAAIASCALAAFAFSPRSDRILAGTIFGVGIVTLLWSRLASIELWLGQVEMLTLVCLACAVFAESRRARIWVGLALGAAVAVKTWPVLFLLWLLRRGWRTRILEWVGVAVAGLITVGIVLIVGKWGGVGDLVAQALSASNQSGLVAYSVWGVSRVLFAESEVGEPLLVSPGLQAASLIIGLVWVLVLVTIVLRWPGPPGLSLFNVAFVVILALPVSHPTYAIVALPTLWWWVGHLVRNVRSAMTWTVVGVLTMWWLILFRISPVGDSSETTWTTLLTAVVATAVAATVSIVCSARIESPLDTRSGRGAAPHPHPART